MKVGVIKSVKNVHISNIHKSLVFWPNQNSFVPKRRASNVLKNNVHEIVCNVVLMTSKLEKAIKMNNLSPSSSIGFRDDMSEQHQFRSTWFVHCILWLSVQRGGWVTIGRVNFMWEKFATRNARVYGLRPWSLAFVLNNFFLLHLLLFVIDDLTSLFILAYCRDELLCLIK